MRKKVVAGNWKMNLDFEQGKQLAEEIVNRIHLLPEDTEVVLMPSFIHLAAIQRISYGYGIQLGAQNVAAFEDGAYTGEISAGMLKSLGVQYCLVGHSERRQYFMENNEDLLTKIKLLLQHGVKPIFCCGEELVSRQNEDHYKVVAKQLTPLWELSETAFSQLLIAYEPVWAIGTGQTAGKEQAQEMHASIRNLISEKISKEIAEKTSILYGGSVKPENAATLFHQEDIDGALVGGASLKTDDFTAIVNCMIE